MPILTLQADPRKGYLLPVKVASSDLHQHSEKEAFALIDTGASHSCISVELAKNLSLKPSGHKLLLSASGFQPCNQYPINMTLCFPHQDYPLGCIAATEFVAPDYFQILLGRDVLALGHLSIAPDGHLTFSL